MDNAAAETVSNAGNMPPPPIPPETKATPEIPVEAYRGQFLARAHVTLDFAVNVPASTPREWLLHGDFWMHHYGKMMLHCEIRVLWEDGSAYARILCTHLQGRLSRFACLEYKVLDIVTSSEIGAEHGLALKMMGTKKYCIVDTKMNNEILMQMIATKAEGERHLAEMIRARTR